MTHGYTGKSEGGSTGDIRIKGDCGLRRNTFGPTELSDGPSSLSRNQSDGKKEYRDLIKAGWTHIVRHVKIQGEANPYDPNWNEYFLNRKKKKIYSNKDGRFVEELGWLYDEWLPYKCLSRMSGNYHVRFLGGKGAVKPLTYPVLPCQLARKGIGRRAETGDEIGIGNWRLYFTY